MAFNLSSISSKKLIFFFSFFEATRSSKQEQCKLRISSHHHHSWFGFWNLFLSTAGYRRPLKFKVPTLWTSCQMQLEGLQKWQDGWPLIIEIIREVVRSNPGWMKLFLCSWFKAQRMEGNTPIEIYACTCIDVNFYRWGRWTLEALTDNFLRTVIFFRFQLSPQLQAERPAGSTPGLDQLCSTCQVHPGHLCPASNPQPEVEREVPIVSNYKYRSQYTSNSINSK